MESPRTRRVIKALLILITLGGIFLVWGSTGELQARIQAMQMYRIYARKMAALAPYISPQEARELGSSWARMDTQADLQAMDERFLALLRQHGLTSGPPPAAAPQ